MNHRVRACIAGRITVSALAVALLTSWSLAQNKIAFVTSEETDGSISELALTGIAAADAICNRLATTAGLDMTNGTYLAWLSDDSTSPDARFTKATIPYLRTDGAKIADNYTDLTDGLLDFIGLEGIEYTEDAVFVETLGGGLASSVWTGTNNDGTATATNCANWTDGTGGDTGMRGATNRGSPTFPNWSDLGATACNNVTRYRLSGVSI